MSVLELVFHVPRTPKFDDESILAAARRLIADYGPSGATVGAIARSIGAPSEAERRMDPRVVATSLEEVVVVWQQRGVSPTGDRLDSPVIGLYRVRDGKLARASGKSAVRAVILQLRRPRRASLKLRP
jgi:hypothetical protein